MTNEELAIEIKAGNENSINALWSQTEKLSYLIIHKFYILKSERLIKLGFEESDLQQEAFFALLQAVDYYKEDSEFKFNTYFVTCLKARLYEIAGLHIKIKEANHQVNTLSLDSPIVNDKDGNEADLASTIPDPFAEAAILAIDENDYSQKLKLDLQEAISGLDELSARLITEHYYNNKSISSLVSELGKSRISLQNTHKKALKYLKSHPILSRYRFNRLKNNLISNNALALKHETSRFKNSHTSLQERYVEQLEDLEAEFGII